MRDAPGTQRAAATTIRVLVPRLPEASTLLPYLERIDGQRIYSNWGPLSQEFARGLCTLTGASDTVLTANGTLAIELALRARAIADRRLCLMPSFTFVASAHAVANAGLVPYLLDVDPGTLALTPAIALDALDRSPEAPAAVLVVSPFGAPVDLQGWGAFEERTRVPVVIDAAAGLTGISEVTSLPLCVSLHATKVLGVGEGGAVLTADTGLAGVVRSMAGFGFEAGSRVSMRRGGNARMSEYAAAVGLAALDGLPARVTHLRQLVAGYRRRLSGRRTHLQEGVGVTWDTMTLNAILPAADVTAATARLDAAGIEWRRWWGMGTHRHPAFEGAGRSPLPVTDEVAPRVVGLPFHDLLTEADLDAIVRCLP